MKKHLLITLISFFLLSGWASSEVSSRYDVAISKDKERIAYAVSGRGDSSLVFIHGWSCDGRYWQEQVPVFAENYQVITIDLAGHGHSSFNRTDFTMISFAHDVKAVLEKEEVGSAILIGHSMGGNVIAEAARLMPEKVVGIIGIDTMHNVAERVPQSVVDSMVVPFEADFEEAAKRFVLPMFPESNNHLLMRWVIEDISSAPPKIGLSAFRNYLNQYVNGETAALFKDMPIPVVSLNARLWPTAEEENRKHIQQYKLFYIEETGHFPMLEKPEAFNPLLEQAIQSIKS